MGPGRSSNSLQPSSSLPAIPYMVGKSMRSEYSSGLLELWSFFFFSSRCFVFQFQAMIARCSLKVMHPSDL